MLRSIALSAVVAVAMAADAVDINMDFQKSKIVHAVDWVGFFLLFGTALVLAYKLMNFTPPAKHVLYFFGYREKGMISLWVNLLAGTAYFARVCTHLSGDPDMGSNFIFYKYFDYLLTCPLLTLDLLWTLNLPYKITYAIFVFVCILSGLLATWSPSPGRYMWFAFGLTIFAFTWYNIITKVQVRFIQYFKKKKDIPANAANKRMSMASKAGFRNKNIRNPLQTALSTYFGIWMAYPVLWILLDSKLIDPITEHCINVVLDVLAKSMYGFALLRFQLLVDKASVNFKQLTVTKQDLMEQAHEEKKAQRRAQMEREKDAESDEEDDDDDEEEDYIPAAPKKGGSRHGQESPQAYEPDQHAVTMPPVAGYPTPEMMQAWMRSMAMSPNGSAKHDGMPMPSGMQTGVAYPGPMKEEGVMMHHSNLSAMPPLQQFTPRGSIIPMPSPNHNPAPLSALMPGMQMPMPGPPLSARSDSPSMTYQDPPRPTMIDENTNEPPSWIPVPQANQLATAPSVPATNWRSAFDAVPPSN